MQSKVGTTGRNRDSMDSLDYEALQNADVREISNTIKERGMNNMLAERIKVHRMIYKCYSKLVTLFQIPRTPKNRYVHWI